MSKQLEKPCMVIGSMIAEPYPPCLEASRGFLASNANDLYTYAVLKEYLEEAREFFTSVLDYEKIALLPTYGASESTITALYIMRKTMRDRRLVVTSSASHESVFKAIDLVGLKPLVVQADSSTRIEAASVEDIISKKSSHIAGIVLNAGTTDLGSIDDIKGIVELASNYHILVYIDAAFGGFPLLLTGKKSILGFEEENVIGFAIDLHKFLAPPPSGFLVLKKEYSKIVEFRAPYMPSKKQIGLLWTRSGLGIAFMHFCLEILGESGLSKIASSLYDKTFWAIGRAKSLDLQTVSDGSTPLIAVNVAPRERKAVAELKKRGIIVYPSSIPGVIRLIVKWCHTRGLLERILDTIRSAVRNKD